jgi:hypothetical protein
MERLKKLERESGSCVGGYQPSFPKGRCRSPRHFKTYVACTETSYFLAWKPMEVWWYCSNLALNK